MPTTQPAHVVLVLQESALLAGSSGHGKAVYGNPYSTLGLAFRPQKERRVCQGSGQRTQRAPFISNAWLLGEQAQALKPKEQGSRKNVFHTPSSGSLAKLFQLC